MMIDTVNQTGQLLALSGDFFSSLRHQADQGDKFTAVRRSVISFVERLPQKSCDSGWTYDHSLVFNTITSEVGGEDRLRVLSENSNIIVVQQFRTTGSVKRTSDLC